MNPPEIKTKAVGKFGKCFVLMPFKPDLDEIYHSIIRSSAQRANLSCARADDIYGPKPIMADIWRSIQDCTVVIADLTTRNPNVFYELGLCHAIQRPVILIAQDVADVPFDLRHVRVITYKNTVVGRKMLAKELSSTLRHVITDIKSGHSRNSYAVLESSLGAELTNAKKVPKLLKDLASKAPLPLLKTLSRLAETDKDQQVDPRITKRVIELLDDSSEEIQEAAITALGAVGSAVHAVHLYKFLSSENPALAKTTCSTLGELRDEGAITLLIKTYAQPNFKACRNDILHALAKIGGEESAQHLFEVASDNHTSGEVKKWALQALSNFDDELGCRKLSELNVCGFDIDSRANLAQALAEAYSPWEKGIQRIIEAQIRKLISDKHPSVRGAALAAWFAHSEGCSEDGWLSEARFWKWMCNESEEVLEHCLEVILASGDRIRFGNAKASQLITIVKKHPNLLKDSIFLLKDTADASASTLMLKAYAKYEDERLWILSYFSRVPNRNAIGLLQEVIKLSAKTSEKCLAALGLARLGIEHALEYLLKHSPEAYGWVQRDIRLFLQQLLTEGKKLQHKQAIELTIRKLHKGDEN